MDMHEIVLAIGVVTFMVYTAVTVAHLIELRRASIAFRQFITKAGENLYPSLSALRGVLEDINRVTADVAMLTQSVRDAAETVKRIETSVKDLYEYYWEGTGETARANIAGVKAGVKAGVTTLLKDLSKKKEGSS